MIMFFLLGIENTSNELEMMENFFLAYLVL